MLNRKQNMDINLVASIERFELIAFFAGYPVIYAIVQFIAGERRAFASRLAMLLPYAYALTGTLFLGLTLKNISASPLKNITEQFQMPYLQIWALLSVLFWTPVFSKKPVFTLLHSLIFFFLLLKDFFMYMVSYLGKDVIKNDMKMYTDSLLLNAGTMAIVALLHFIWSGIRGNKKISV